MLCIISAIQCHADFSWVTWMQGGSSAGVGVAADHRGNSYIIGNFSGTVLFGSNTLTSAGGSDVFVAKLGRRGHVRWVISVGGTNDDSAHKILAARDGTLFIIATLGADTSFGETTGLSGAFLAKISRRGAIEWVRSLTNVWASTAILDRKRRVWFAGTASGFLSFSSWSSKGENFTNAVTDASGCRPTNIGIGSDGSLYFTSISAGYGSEATFGTNRFSGRGNVFVAKFDSNGRHRWVGIVGFEYQPVSVGLAVARDESVSIVGNVVQGFSPSSASWVSPSSRGYPSAAYFAARFSPSGELASAGVFGQYKASYALGGIATDWRGNTLTVGGFSSSYVGGTPWLRGGFINGPAFSVIITGAYISRAPGAAASYPIGTIAPRAIAADAKGFAYVTGDFSGTALLGTNRVGTTWSGPSQAFVARLNDAVRRR